MAQSKLITSLFKIDAAEAFVRYVENVKPYHSKILDVLIEYVYKEDIRAKITEKWTTEITQTHGGGSCRFTVIPALTVYGAGGSLTIEGLHQKSFRSGDRFVVEHAATWSRNHTVDHSVQSGDTTTIYLVPSQSLETDPIAVQLTTTPDYHIIGAIVGDPGAWVIDGNYPNKFQVGETVMTTTHKGEYGAGIFTITSIVASGTHTTLYVAEPVLANIVTSGTVNDPYFQAFGSGTLRYVPLVITQIDEPITSVIGAIWLNPVTNSSRRWNGTAWTYNYTPTSHAWFLDYAEPKQLIISSAVGQIDNPADLSYGTSNSFVVDTTGKFVPHGFTTVSTAANKFMFSDAYVITGVDTFANKWSVTGVVDVSVGETIHITSSSTVQGMGQYTVASVVTTAGNTVIEVTRRISRLASGDGILAVPTNIETVPRWIEGTQVSVVSTLTLPSPLTIAGTYYFVPAVAPSDVTPEQPAIFALSKVRNPHSFDDYVDITTLGTGLLSITQAEPYVPGTKIHVRDSFNSRNNGMYTILQIEELANDLYRIFVQERVPSTTPAGQLHDGVMTYDLDSHFYSSITERPCKVNDESELHVSTHIHEFIQFEFEIDRFDFIAAKLLENEPYTSFLRDLGYDFPSYDTIGFDGDISLHVGSTRGSLRAPDALVHNILPIGFDTQYFDLGEIDEDLASTMTYHGRTVYGVGASNDTYVLTSSVSAIDEGLVVTITLTSSARSQTVPYIISGNVTFSDFVGVSNFIGHFVVLNHVATLVLPIAPDYLYEGIETFTVTIPGFPTPISIDIDINNIMPGLWWDSLTSGGAAVWDIGGSPWGASYWDV